MEPIRQAAVITVDDPTQVPVTRRAAVEAGRRLDLPVATLANLEIIAVELANNILQHAGTPGEIFLSSNIAGTAVQIVAVDKGRGIADIPRSLEDGFSTRDTPGTGLGAVQRLGHSLDIYSRLGAGTVVSVLVGPTASISGPADANSTTAPSAATAALCTAIAGETVSGDSWAVASTPSCDLYLLADGLGHGLQASEAASLAIDIFRRSTHLGPAAIVEAMHAGMRSTRGAAVAVLSADHAARRITCCGVGNISCLLHAPDGRSQSLVSLNGTVGHQMRRAGEFLYTFVPGSTLVLHSDGVSTGWKPSSYPNLFEHRSATVAGVLYRDAARRRDDAMVVVSQLSGHPASPGTPSRHGSPRE